MIEFDSMNKAWERRFNTVGKAPGKIILRRFKFLLSYSYRTKELKLNSIPKLK